MPTNNLIPSGLHHNAYLTKDQEANRKFYEELIGLPLVATWSETDELFGAERVIATPFTVSETAADLPSSSSPTKQTKINSIHRLLLHHSVTLHSM